MKRTFLTLLLALSSSVFFSSTLVAKDFDDKECLDCHGVKGYAVPTGKTGSSTKRSLDLNYSAMQDSVHGKVQCTDCHTDIEKVPHKREELSKVDCINCHQELESKRAESETERLAKRVGRKQNIEKQIDAVVEAVKYKKSIHANTKKEGNATCYSCHTSHYVYPSSDPRALNNRENSPEMCGECHEKALKQYNQSVHVVGIKRPWISDSATCSDCHTSHEIIGSKALEAHRMVTKNCGNCHEKEVSSYMSTTHGQLAWLGKDKIARCVSCHTGHKIHKKDNPASMVSDENRLETCQECHKDADENILKYRPHGNTTEFDKYPFMYITGKLMITIVIITLLFFYSHSMLWFYREYKSRVVEWHTVKSRSIPHRVKPEKKHSDKHFERFKWYWRLNHWVLVLTVMVLTLTGMSVLYADSEWAMKVTYAFGGPATFGIVHRLFGMLFLLSIFGHGMVILDKLLEKKKSFDWFGPDSLLPRWKDWHDMKAQFAWFFGKGEQPKFDRWTYWEKFDYWAVYWGAIVIGISGIILWASPSLIKHLPGWAFNVAALAHGVEAFLAVTTLFVVHFFNNHFRPAKFPLDTVMFSGSWDLEEFKEERPLEYERLLKSGELDKRLVAPPSKKANVLYHVLGFSLLTIGILLLILVMIGFSGRGLG